MSKHEMLVCVCVRGHILQMRQKISSLKFNDDRESNHRFDSQISIFNVINCQPSNNKISKQIYAARAAVLKRQIFMQLQSHIFPSQTLIEFQGAFHFSGATGNVRATNMFSGM